MDCEAPDYLSGQRGTWDVDVFSEIKILADD